MLFFVNWKRTHCMEYLTLCSSFSRSSIVFHGQKGLKFIQLCKYSLFVDTHVHMHYSGNTVALQTAPQTESHSLWRWNLELCICGKSFFKFIFIFFTSLLWFSHYFPTSQGTFSFLKVILQALSLQKSIVFEFRLKLGFMFHNLGEKSMHAHMLWNWGWGFAHVLYQLWHRTSLSFNAVFFRTHRKTT